MKRMFFLINPVAGKQAIGNQLIPILDMFTKADFEITVHISQSGQDVTDAFSTYAVHYDTMVCCGGDGTLNTATDALIKSGAHPRFGYIPAGTVNDFATTYGIPKNPIEAAKIIAAGNSKMIDVGRFNGRAYVYVAAFGSIADVSYSTPQKMKNTLGRMAYLVEGAKNFLHMKPYKITFSCDGKEIDGDFIYGSLSNSSSIGGFKLPIMRDYSFNDGLMEVLLVRKPKNLADANKIFNCMVTQKADGEMVTYMQAHEIHYTSAEEIPWSLDGEYGGSFKEADITMQHQVLDMIC